MCANIDDHGMMTAVCFESFVQILRPLLPSILRIRAVQLGIHQHRVRRCVSVVASQWPSALPV